MIEIARFTKVAPLCALTSKTPLIYDCSMSGLTRLTLALPPWWAATA